MLSADLHSHTLFSKCGMLTHMELLEQAKRVGVELLAITDHGSAVGGRIPGTFFERMQQPEPSVHLLKGIECNVLDTKGTIDLPQNQLKWIDIVLLGLHKNLPVKESESINTSRILAAIEKNPAVDIITHPNDPNFPVNFNALAVAAKERGIALEVNNSKIMYGRTTVAHTRHMLEQFANVGVLIAVNSDTHAPHELGRDSEVRPIIEEVGYSEELIINRSKKSALRFLEERKKNKL